jgi:hypothetical protein
MMRRLLWIIGAALALIMLIGGLVVVALIARSGAYRPATGETSVVSVALPTGSAPSPGVSMVAATSQPLAATSTQPIPAARTATPRTNSARATAGAFASGQQAMTRPSDARDLWTAPEGGERVFARPRLYGGALVTILAITQGAVQVRTPEGVEGWIHEPAERALTEDLTIPATSAVFVVGVRVRIVWPNGIPLRVQPDPNALKVLERLAPGQAGTLQELRGDWLLVALDDGTAGWARWYYDDQIYVATAQSGAAPTATAMSDFEVVGLRVGTGDSQRVRVVIDLARMGDEPSTLALWDAPLPQLMNDAFNVRVRARVPSAPAVRYLTTQVRELVEVTASRTAEGLDIQIVPSSPLYLRESFFLPRDAPDSPAEYDRVVVDLCFAADCPALR